MNKSTIKNFFPVIPGSLLFIVFIHDFLTYYNRSAFQSSSLPRELLIVSAFLLLVPFIKKSKWVVEKNIANKIKALILSVASIYCAFFIPRLFLLPGFKLTNRDFDFIFSSIRTLIYATLSSILATIFGILILLLLRDLIFAKRKQTTHRNFRLTIYIMIIQIIYLNYLQSTNLSEGGKIGTIILIIVILLIVINSFRTSWVNFLNKRQKIACFGWGLILLPAVFMLTNFTHHEIITAYSVSLGILLQQVKLFLSIYWSMAMLSILFHLPTAGIYDRKKKEVESLHSLSRSITLEFDPDKLVVMITKQPSEVIEANAVWLEVIDSHTGKLNLASSNNLKQIEQHKIKAHSQNETSDWILKNRTALLVNEVSRDHRTKYLQKVNRNIGSLLGVPLISYDKIIGILYAIKYEEYGFEIDNRNMLQAFADQAAVALENARLVKESIIKERLEQELKIAHDAQMKLLPKTMPQIKGLDIDAICVTANEVGGDYYDFFELTENKLAIVIGDVSGKGPEAAFYMAEVKGIIESLSKTSRSPRDILIKTNEILYETFDKKTFITLIYGIIDVAKMKLTFSRAGHCPLIYSPGGKKTAHFIEPQGIGLGLEQGKLFEKTIKENELILNPNDLLLFYTDGVVEACNSQKQEFGEQHLLEITTQLSNLNSSEIKTKLVDEVKSFAGLADQHDDLTIVVVKVV